MIWTLADIVNGLMAIPNLIALIGLSGVVVAETRRFNEHVKKEERKKKAKQKGNCIICEIKTAAIRWLQFFIAKHLG